MNNNLSCMFQSAVLKHDLHKAQNLLDQGADINYRNRYGDSILLILLQTFSAKNQKAMVDSIQWLLQKGADPNLVSKTGLSPLQRAIINIKDQHESEFNNEMIDKILVGGYEEIERHYEQNEQCATSIIALLIKYEADLNYIGESGHSILLTAIINKHCKIARYLIKQGVNYEVFHKNSKDGALILRRAHTFCSDIIPDLLAPINTIAHSTFPLFIGNQKDAFPCHYQVQIDDENRLYLNQNGHFKWRVLTWQQGFQSQRFRNGQWIDAAHDCEIALLYYRYNHYRIINPNAYVWLQLQIPAEIINKIEMYNFAQPLMLHWVASLPYAFQMANHSPGTLWMLAGLYIQQPELFAKDDISTFFTWPLSKITQLLGGQGLKSETKMIRRNDLKVSIESNWHSIRYMLINGYLQKLDFICSMPILMQLEKYPWVMQNNNLLKHYAKKPLKLFNREEMQYTFIILEDTVKIAQMLSIFDYKLAIKKCKTPKQLYQLHDHWLSRLLKQYDSDLLQNLNWAKPFPASPIPDNNLIKYIPNGLKLLQESIDMSHCVSIYTYEAYSGNCFYYHINYDRPATLELRSSRDKKIIYLRQFYGEHNTLPDRAVKNIAWQWLKKYNIKS
ncbi:MAG: hypothetical protein HN826_11455, partial [Methylococcales bacterium]|nr:hypothetical protein [Methylococcales bacterium]